MIKATKNNFIFLGSLTWVILLSACTLPQPIDPINDSQSEFVHPGIINRESTLLRLEKIPDDNASYQILLSYIDTNPVAKNYPDIFYVGTGSDGIGQMRIDANLAYAYALKWAKTGHKEDADKAIRILNGWAYNFIRMELMPDSSLPTQQLQLQASWVAPSFAAAAEIIRHHKHSNSGGAGWPQGDIEKFQTFLAKLEGYLDDMIVDIREKGRRINNWGTSAGYAKMAIGVFNESLDSYTEGEDLLLYLLPLVIQPNGEVFELCSRDCWHPQYTLSGLTYGAETSHIQGGISIYWANNQRLKTGWEWMASVYAGDVSCRMCTSIIVPAVEIAAAYYHQSFALDHFSSMQRPYGIGGSDTGGSNTFLGFTTLTHFATQ